jgi:menaquinol-cytochrome c reductase iron-sulfur subunit
MSDLLKYPGESRNDSLPPEGKAAAHLRRTFLFKLSILLNVAVGTVLAVPLVGYLLGPALKKESSVGAWVNLGRADDYPVGETRLVDFESPVASLGDGQTAKVACWVRRVSARQFQVFAVNCAHLGCPVRWFAESRLFMCPCHGGAYYQDGSRAAGPPERGLFEYSSKLDGDALVIHAGNMPTLVTQASCQGSRNDKQLVQIVQADNAMRSTPWRT